MLAELYEQLKEAFPTRGLEIVFVSSDRDAASFRSYFAAMPWIAVPVSSDAFPRCKQRLSETYGIRGIPSLVVLDAMSGQVVSTTESCRGEVVNACNRGGDAIEAMFLSWIDRLPPETKEMTSMLELSVADVESSLASRHCSDFEPGYLCRSAKAESKVEIAVRVDLMFERLVKEQGMLPNSAAAKAISIATGHASSVVIEMCCGQLTEDASDSGSARSTDPMKILMQQAGEIEQASDALATALKYMENARREPWNPKFRRFKLSNKNADRIMPALEILVSFWGMEVVCMDSDYYGSIPIGMELDESAQQLHRLVEEARAKQDKR
jgi:hypothetical protein